MNERAHIAALIEKNRRALLRMVRCWLAMAVLARLTRQYLPRRVSCYADMLISKAEAATGALMMALGYQRIFTVNDEAAFLAQAMRHSAGADFWRDKDDLETCIDDMIARLRALKTALNSLAVKANYCADCAVKVEAARLPHFALMPMALCERVFCAQPEALHPP